MESASFSSSSLLSCTYVTATILNITHNFFYVPINCPSFFKYPDCTNCEYSISVNRSVFTSSANQHDGSGQHTFSHCHIGSLTETTTDINTTCAADNLLSTYRLDLKGTTSCVVSASQLQQAGAGTSAIRGHLIKVRDPMGLTWCHVTEFSYSDGGAPSPQLDEYLRECVTSPQTLVAVNGRAAYTGEPFHLANSASAGLSVVIHNRNFSVFCQTSVPAATLAVRQTIRAPCNTTVYRASFTPIRITRRDQGYNITMRVAITGLTNIYETQAVYFFVSSDNRQDDPDTTPAPRSMAGAGRQGKGALAFCTAHRKMRFNVIPFGPDSPYAIENKKIDVTSLMASMSWTGVSSAEDTSNNSSRFAILWKPEKPPTRFLCKTEIFPEHVKTLNTSRLCPTITVNREPGSAGAMDFLFSGFQLHRKTYMAAIVAEKKIFLRRISFRKQDPSIILGPSDNNEEKEESAGTVSPTPDWTEDPDYSLSPTEDASPADDLLQPDLDTAAPGSPSTISTRPPKDKPTKPSSNMRLFLLTVLGTAAVLLIAAISMFSICIRPTK
ncbi:glycoprotein 350 [Common bottlenose dolphin gammaherpesvirus 1 strain Sarasota]|uniref:Glycoprotein 350 n=1 Tax=Common bottlenose dolphin gammaherpesvirus 1 strain Sarasota TaxID=2022783 RepID=A0A1Z1NEJ4_9GAMA|nr:glycoprotein 350 [Common bottlenose dolphin gammaherpesvirus 1 strain Sarasota]ARW78113.1 glycoprotein 350 [Common bottlenose dolphin gammaherpesvirus 1 strain Sarasota]